MPINALQRRFPATQSPYIIRAQTQDVEWTAYIGGKFATGAKRGAGTHYIQTLRSGGIARASNSFASQQLSDMFVTNGQLEFPLYYLRARASVLRDDEARAGLMNIGLQNELKLAGMNAISQGLHRACLYGFNGSTNEGLFNTTGIVNTPLPADTGGHTTIATYLPNQLLNFLLTQINLMEASMKNMALVTVIAGPVTTLNYIRHVSRVATSDYQSPGAGSKTVGNALNEIRKASGKPEIQWVEDNSLIGKGTSSVDALLLIAPEIKEVGIGDFSTNQFGAGGNSMKQNIVMVSDSVDLLDLTFQDSADATSSTLEFYTTPGQAVRSEAVRILSVTTSA